MSFWYDFASPYSYIAAMRIEGQARANGIQVSWEPFLLGPIFQRRASDPTPFQNASPEEMRYRRRDVERLCHRHGLPLSWPSRYPRGSLLAARVAYAGRDHGWCADFSRRVFHANFAEDRDIGTQQTVTEILQAMRLPAADVLDQAQSTRIKEGLRAQVDRAVASGIFGAPSFLVEGELFWGNDRLEQAVEWACAAKARAATGI